MNKFVAGFVILLISFEFLHAQMPKKRLPQNVNVPTYSHIFPSLSGDGNQMIFLTNYTNSEGFETKYTYRTGKESWADPEPIPSINRPGLDHIGSFCLSYDGNFVVFSSRRTPSIGNYDIWISEKKGKFWSQPKNPGKPLNSPAHEGNPSLSPDGKSIYFMRCESMDNTRKTNCILYASHRISATRWSKPEPLPDHINTGHETTPRIMADNKTLIFASGRAGGKGKLDLYSSKLEFDEWTHPQPLNFLNTNENDEFISVPARGDIIYFSGMYRDQFNIYKAIIPEELRPDKVLMLTGSVTYDDDKKPSEDILIQAFDASTIEVYTTTRLKQDDNSYTIFLPEGASYDVSAFPQKGGHTYDSKIFDLENMLISRKEEFPINLSSVQNGIIMPLSTIRYENYTSLLSRASDVEVKRITGFLKKNPEVRIEIGVYIDSLFTDSIPSNDLTEIIADTVFYQVVKNEPQPVFEDADFTADFDTSTITSDIFFNGDSSLHLADSELSGNGTVSLDSINTNNLYSNQNIQLVDSLLMAGFVLFNEQDSVDTYMLVNFTYHNDRTQKQADALMLKLIESGVPGYLLEAKGYGANWQVDRATEERNYWVELKVLE